MVKDPSRADKITGNVQPNTTSAAVTSGNLNSPGTLATTQPIQRLRFEMDDNYNAWSRPVVLMLVAGSSVVQAGATAPKDGYAGDSNANLGVTSFPELYNGTTWDKARENNQLATVTDTTTANYVGPDIPTYNARNVMVAINCSSLTGTSYSPQLQWKNQAGTYNGLWQQNTAKTSATFSVIVLGMGSAGYVINAGTNGSTGGIAGFSQADSAGSPQLGYAPLPVPPTIRVLINKTAVTGFSATIDVVLQN